MSVVSMSYFGYQGVAALSGHFLAKQEGRQISADKRVALIVSSLALGVIGALSLMNGSVQMLSSSVGLVEIEPLFQKGTILLGLNTASMLTKGHVHKVATIVFTAFALYNAGLFGVALYEIDAHLLFAQGVTSFFLGNKMLSDTRQICGKLSPA